MIKFEKNTYDNFFVYVVNPSTSDSNAKQIQVFINKVTEYVMDKENIKADDILTSVIL